MTLTIPMALVSMIICLIFFIKSFKEEGHIKYIICMISSIGFLVALVNFISYLTS